MADIRSTASPIVIPLAQEAPQAIPASEFFAHNLRAPNTAAAAPQHQQRHRARRLSQFFANFNTFHSNSKTNNNDTRFDNDDNDRAVQKQDSTEEYMSDREMSSVSSGRTFSPRPEGTRYSLSSRLADSPTLRSVASIKEKPRLGAKLGALFHLRKDSVDVVGGGGGSGATRGKVGDELETGMRVERAWKADPEQVRAELLAGGRETTGRGTVKPAAVEQRPRLEHACSRRRRRIVSTVGSIFAEELSEDESGDECGSCRLADIINCNEADHLHAKPPTSASDHPDVVAAAPDAAPRAHPQPPAPPAPPVPPTPQQPAHADRDADSDGSKPLATRGASDANRDSLVQGVVPLISAHDRNSGVQPQTTLDTSPLHPQPRPSSPSAPPPANYAQPDAGDPYQGPPPDAAASSSPPPSANPPTMISPHQSSSSGHSAPQPSFPPYPYAHQPPQPSSSRLHGHRLPHSHHGHTSTSAFASPPPPPQLRATSPPPALPYLQKPGQPSSPPTVPVLNQTTPKTNWWSHLTFIPRVLGKKEKESANPAEWGTYHGPDNPAPQGVVFGRPLKESLEYASVQISTANSNGELYTWGYIPVVVAKCGLYLKENATEVPGTFRINGSARRMRILQEAFETPPRYGKNLDWKQEEFTTHDVASVFRRYLTQMPEPVIPHDLYHQFRDALAKEPFNQEEVIARYKSLIRQMPRANQYLLLYVLDLLNVFSRKSEINLMTATNLAVIFRPGLISHPNHEMSPKEHALSQKVLEFLIAQQDWFMLEIPPPPPRRGSTQQHAAPSSSPYSSSDPNFTTSSMPPTATTTRQERRGSAQYNHHPSSSSPNPSALSSHKHNVSSHNHNSFGIGNASYTSAPVPYTSGDHASAPTRTPLPPARSSSRFGSRRPLSGVGSDVDDVMVIPAEGGGEEFSAGGGWRLFAAKNAKEKEKEEKREKERLKMMRRRTTMERSDLITDTEAETEQPSPTTSDNHGVTVKRSRTLPSSRRKNQTHNSSGELVTSGKENVQLLGSGSMPKRGILLKKNRRISANAIEKERTS